MSRTLPPRPDFDQLRHQAKDLLRAHRQKDSAACGPLRQLRQFASADDKPMFAAPLALHDAQYALALEYGFSSWNAMKRYIEVVTGRPSPVRRDSGRTYISGLETHGIGCKDDHDSSVIACLAGAMAAVGESFSYPYLLGTSGAAFRVQMQVPNWGPSAACAPCGYDCVPGAMAVTGYRLRCVNMQHDGQWLSDGVKEAIAAVPANIDRGVPIILIGKESGLIVGYRDDGQFIFRPYEYHNDGYQDMDIFGAASSVPQAIVGKPAANDWAWGIGIVTPSDVPMNRHHAFVHSLQLAVTLATTERFGNYLSGFAAIDHWVDALLDDSRFDTLTLDNWFTPAHANGYCYPCLYSARRNAERYLREMADDYSGALRLQILELAELYKQMHQTLSRTQPEFPCIWSLMPWTLKSPDNWTRAIRQKQSDLLREMGDIERQAISRIESLLATLEPTPASS